MCLKGKRLLVFTLVMVVFVFMLTSCSSNGKVLNEEKQPSKKIEEKNISIEELEKNLDNKDYIIVDLRKDEAYQGYSIDGVARGGHIKNAIQFPVNWIEEVKNQKEKSLKDLLIEKGIKEDKTIVLYHSDNSQTSKMFQELGNLGYKNVLKFENLNEWAKNNELEMTAFSNYKMLVYPEWVNSLIKGEKPQTYEGKEFKILEASWGNEAEAYKKGHIPGSYHFNTENIETEENDWNLASPDVMKKSLETYGISPDTTVVVYSEDVSAASRVYFALAWAGVKDVRFLNGGIKAWTDAKLELETKENTPTPIKDFGVPIPQHPEYNISMPKDVLEKQKDPNFRLVSIRSWQEFIGETSGYDYIKEKGEPKGAVWGHAGSDANSMEDYLDIDGTLRNPLEMEKLWAEWDIKKENEISFYCGTGWRACVPWIDANVLGYEKVTVFDGGWYIWAMDKNNPVQVGDPRKK